jgi:hypothetical protein
MVSYLREALGESVPKAEHLLNEINQLKAELAQHAA